MQNDDSSAKAGGLATKNDAIGCGNAALRVASLRAAVTRLQPSFAPI
jgi:hypothetical protein